MNIFEYKNYRSYLEAIIKQSPRKGHGLRQRWADAMECKVSFVSHIFNGRYELSLEQAERLARYLHLDHEETEFLMLLVIKERAGTHQLKKFYNQIIQEKIDKHLYVPKSVVQNTLSLEDQGIYYSSWLYLAVHMIVSIEEFQSSPEKIAAYFNTPVLRIKEVLKFLESKQFIKWSAGRYSVVKPNTIINADSPFFHIVHTFWKQKALEAVSQNNPEDINMQLTFTVSSEDVKKIKKILRKSFDDIVEIIQPSKEEKLYSIGFDLFEVR